MLSASQKKEATTFHDDTPPWPSLEGRRWVFPNFPLHGMSLGHLWLEVVNPTLLLVEVTFTRTGWICFKKCQVRLRHNQPGVLLIRRQKLWHPPSRNLRQAWQAKFVVQNVLYSFSGDAYRISYLIIQLNVCHPSCIRSKFSWVVLVAGRQDLGSSSRLSLPHLNSAAYFCTVDKAGASSRDVATPPPPFSADIW